MRVKVVETIDYFDDRECHYIGLEVNGFVKWYGKVVKSESNSSNNNDFYKFEAMRETLMKIEKRFNQFEQKDKMKIKGSDMFILSEKKRK